MFHTRGTLPGSRGPEPPSLLIPPGVPCPGNIGLSSGRRGPATAASNTCRACSSPTPNRSRYTSARNTAGMSVSGTSCTRTGTSRPSPVPGTCSAAAAHSSVVYRDRSKYAVENNATTRPHRSSASLIASMKFRPAAQSHTSSSTVYPASVNCQATHSAHARSAPA